jgi:dTDP-D-glucose 4,6-dehydratase
LSSAARFFQFSFNACGAISGTPTRRCTSLLSNPVVKKQILALCGRSAALIRHIADRKAHDQRHSIATATLRALVDAVRWYREHEGWWRTNCAFASFAEHDRRIYQQTGRA